MSLAPEEIEETAGLSGAEGMEEFHEIYEKARYGKERCGQNEVVRMKELR